MKPQTEAACNTIRNLGTKVWAKIFLFCDVRQLRLRSEKIMVRIIKLSLDIINFERPDWVASNLTPR